MGNLASRTLKEGHTIFFCGNGGSSCDASHIAAELVVRFKSQNERIALRAISLGTDQAILTACGNDYGYDQVFARHLEGLGKANDLLIGISTSGNSKNVILAVEKAKSMGISVGLMLGGTGGALNNQGNAQVLVPSTVTARIQECHILVGHILCTMIEKSLFGF